MIHQNNRFFIWFYYPMGNHTSHNFKNFYFEAKPWLLEVYNSKKEKIDNTINNFYEESILNFHSNYFPGSSPRRKIMGGVFAIFSSAKGERRECGNLSFHLERPDCRPMVLRTQDEVTKSRWNEQVKGFIELVTIFNNHFNIIFGMGYRDFNQWWDSSYDNPLPETRVWPYNMYDLSSYPEDLKERLKAFSRSNDDWTLKIIEDRTAIFYMNDLTRWEHEVDPEVTRAILGEGDDLLVPNVGYPPPTVIDP